MTEAAPYIEFLIGEEKRLADIIARPEVEPLFRSAVKLGLSRAVLLDEKDFPFVTVDAEDSSITEPERKMFPILVEGEPQGTLQVEAKELTPAIEVLGRLLHDALQLIVTNNLKRMLTTEVHTSIVKESYEQLVATNHRLMESERRYRKLAAELEVKVEERTAELRQAYNRMLQQEKLAAVGQLAAGMAHEINNPLGFILSNLKTFKKYQLRIAEMLGRYRELLTNEESSLIIRQQSEAHWKKLKIDFLLEDSGILLGQSLEGVERIAKIVSELNGFSHLEGMDEKPMQINKELEILLAGLAPQFPPYTKLTTEFKETPSIICRLPLMNQAFANILDNALKSRSEGLELSVATELDKGGIVVTITDNGCGILPENLPRIFDPFFTTREVGSGTGMGLAVAREAINSAGGSIEASSTPGKGTIVRVMLPVK